MQRSLTSFLRQFDARRRCALSDGDIIARPIDLLSTLDLAHENVQFYPVGLPSIVTPASSFLDACSILPRFTDLVLLECFDQFLKELPRLGIFGLFRLRPLHVGIGLLLLDLPVFQRMRARLIWGSIVCGTEEELAVVFASFVVGIYALSLLGGDGHNGPCYTASGMEWPGVEGL